MKRFYFQTAKRGQVLLFFSLSLPMTLALIGFVVDVGWAQYRQTAAKNAAESGALAGAITAQSDSSQSCSGNWTCQASTACPSTLNTSTNPVQVACMYAKQNGFTNGANGGKQTVKVAANTTSSGISGVNPSYWVTVTVSERLPLTFLSVLGQQFVTVSHQSTAGTWLPSAGGCIYTLNPTATDISMNGVTTLTTGCGVYDNSSSASAISIV